MIDILSFPSDPDCVQQGLREVLVKVINRGRDSKPAMALLKVTLKRALELCDIAEKEEEKRAEQIAKRQAIIEADAYARAEFVADEEAEAEEELAEDILEECGLVFQEPDCEEHVIHTTWADEDD